MILTMKYIRPDVPANVDFDFMPYEIPGVLEQDDINKIFEIVKNYTAYCLKAGFPLIWPEIGQYEHWPLEFTQFAEEKRHYDRVPWFGKDSDGCYRSSIEEGFSCEPNFYYIRRHSHDMQHYGL